MKEYFKYVYSDYLEKMIPFRFQFKNKTYEWNELDLVYYNIDTDEDYFEELPKGAVI